MLDLLTIGDIKLDTFIKIPDASVSCEQDRKTCRLCIEYGKKIQAEEISSQIAGSAPNVAIGIAKMQKNTGVYSIMGKDRTYDMATDFLASAGVETTYIQAQEGVESSFAAVLNYQGESTQLVSHHDAPFRLKTCTPKSTWIHIAEMGTGYEDLFADLTECQEHHNVRISINPGERQITERKDIFLQLLKQTELLFLNRREAGVLLETSPDDIAAITQQLFNLGPTQVIVTDGRDGAYAYDGETLTFAPMFPGERVEATGAGDAFATGYLGAIMHDQHPAEALTWGAVNSASVVQHVGATRGLLTQNEIKKQLKNQPDYKTETR